VRLTGASMILCQRPTAACRTGLRKISIPQAFRPGFGVLFWGPEFAKGNGETMLESKKNPLSIRRTRPRTGFGNGAGGGWGCLSAFFGLLASGAMVNLHFPWNPELARYCRSYYPMFLMALVSPRRVTWVDHLESCARHATEEEKRSCVGRESDVLPCRRGCWRNPAFHQGPAGHRHGHASGMVSCWGQSCFMTLEFFRASRCCGPAGRSPKPNASSGKRGLPDIGR